MIFKWDQIQYRPDGKVFLLWRHERIFEEGLVRPGMKACDVGGWGHLYERLEQEGVDVITLDKFTRDQYFADRVRTGKYIEADICFLPYMHLSKSFDLVTCFEVLEHVGRGDSQFAAISNMIDMLVPGGHLVGTFPLPGGTHPADDPEIFSWLNAEELSKFLTMAGANVLALEETGSINKDDKPVSLYFKARKPHED